MIVSVIPVFGGLLDFFIAAKSLWKSSFSNNNWVNGARVPRGLVRLEWPGYNRLPAASQFENFLLFEVTCNSNNARIFSNRTECLLVSPRNLLSLRQITKLNCLSYSIL